MGRIRGCQALGKSAKAWQGWRASPPARGAKVAVFRGWRGLARSLQYPWHGRPDGPAAGSGRHEMTFNLANLQQFAVSVVGALIAASVFVSAAVGPVGQFI
jgi:hypothetical protein